jgi:hypothetical protein
VFFHSHLGTEVTVSVQTTTTSSESFGVQQKSMKMENMLQMKTNGDTAVKVPVLIVMQKNICCFIFSFKLKYFFYGIFDQRFIKRGGYTFKKSLQISQSTCKFVVFVVFSNTSLSLLTFNTINEELIAELK